MRKIFKTSFLSILILSFLILPKFSFAESYPPPTVTTKDATNILEIGATLNATVNPEGAFTRVYFSYGDCPSLTTSICDNSGPGKYRMFTVDQNVSAGFLDVDFSASVAGLSPNTTYYFRAISVRDLVVGDIFSFSTLSSQKLITKFAFLGLNPPVEGVINEPNKTVAIDVPPGTNVRALTPTILVSNNATVNPASGVSRNFTNPVHYTVTAQDGTTQNYVATVITGNGAPAAGGGVNNNNNGDGDNVIKSSDPGGLVPCGTKANPKACDFNDIMKLINTIINFVLFVIAVPLAAIMFAYAGFMLVTSGGSSEKMSQAKSIFGNVAIGLIIAAAAWLIVHTILNIVGFDGSWIGL